MKLLSWLVIVMASAALVLLARTQNLPVQDDELAVYSNGDPDAVGRSFDDQREIVNVRLLEKNRVARQLLRGGITLDQAAQRFREVVADDPKAVEFLRKMYSATGDEIYYRNVLTFALQIVRGEPTLVTTDLLALAAEVDRRFPAGATVEPVRP